MTCDRATSAKALNMLSEHGQIVLSVDIVLLIRQPSLFPFDPLFLFAGLPKRKSAFETEKKIVSTQDLPILLLPELSAPLCGLHQPVRIAHLMVIYRRVKTRKRDPKLWKIVIQNLIGAMCNIWPAYHR